MTGALQINLQFMKWELIVAAFLLLIAVFIARGKGIKHAVVFSVITFLLLGSAFATKCMVYLALDDRQKAIEWGIAWIPTILFVSGLVVSTLFGVWRGLRKSALFLLHSVCAAAVCLGLFFFFTRSRAFDKLLLKIGDAVTGGLADKLGVDAECTTLREVLAAWLPSRLNYGAEVAIVLRENGAYLLTVVDMVYRIAFAFVCYLLYLLIVFILYIVYHAAYSERKYKSKVEEKVRENQTDRPYRAHRIAGGAVGLARGFVAGVLSLSLLGSVLFMAADLGKNKSLDLSFSNNNMDFAFSVYDAADDYGEHGIFRFLNSLHGTDGSPYYLFAADLIFSGRLSDEVNAVNANVNFRKEIGAYTRFARRTAALLLEYGGDEMRAALDGTGSKKDAVLHVMQMPQFQMEFEGLIDEFESQTYIINFALAAANSLIANIDDTRFASSMSETNRELMKVMFKAGYLSEKIPDEREMLAAGKEGNQPYIGVSQVFTKNDAKVLYRMAASFLTKEGSTLDLVRTLLPQIQELSMMSGARAAQLDPLYGRLYCFLANTYLAGDDDAGVRYESVAKANVSWVDEINALLTVAEDGFTLYDTVRAGEGSTLDKVLDIFDEEAPDYATNVAAYDSLAETVSSSKLIGKVLSTGYMRGKIGELFRSVSENVYIPSAVTYENTATQKGELYQLLYGMRLLGAKENREVLEKLTENDADPQIEDLFDLIARANTAQDDKGNTLAKYLIDSTYLRSLVSSLMLEQEESLYVPDTALEREGGHTVALVKKETLAQLFDALADGEVKQTVLDFLQNEDAEISTLVYSDALARVLDMGNGIIEGTLSLQLESELRDAEKVRVPYALRVTDGVLPDGWLTRDANAGELRKLTAALRLPGVDIDEILDNGKMTKENLHKVLSASENAPEVLFASDIIHATFSDAVMRQEFKLWQNHELIVPAGVTDMLPDGTTLIRRDELKKMCRLYADATLTSTSDTKAMLRQLVAQKDGLGDSAIVSASVANYLVTDASLSGKGLYIPARYVAAGQKSALQNNSASVVLWQKELVAFVDGVEILFDLSEDGDTGESENLLKVSAVRGLQDDEWDAVYASVLLSGSVSDALLKNRSLLVPASVVNGDCIIDVQELKALIAVFDLYADDTVDVDKWEPEWRVPDRTEAAVLVQSATARAMLTATVSDHNLSRSMRVYSENMDYSAVRVYKESDGSVVREEAGSAMAIHADQLLCIFDVLTAVPSEEGQEFALPSLHVENLLALQESDLQRFYACDELRYRIGAVLQTYASLTGIPQKQEDCYDLSAAYDPRPDDATYYDYDDVLKCLSELREMMP